MKKDAILHLPNMLNLTLHFAVSISNLKTGVCTGNHGFFPFIAFGLMNCTAFLCFVCLAYIMQTCTVQEKLLRYKSKHTYMNKQLEDKAVFTWEQLSVLC